jgi:hypothetical protein
MLDHTHVYTMADGDAARDLAERVRAAGYTAQVLGRAVTTNADDGAVYRMAPGSVPLPGCTAPVRHTAAVRAGTATACVAVIQGPTPDTASVALIGLDVSVMQVLPGRRETVPLPEGAGEMP